MTLGWATVGGATAYRVQVATSTDDLGVDCQSCSVHEVVASTTLAVPGGALAAGTTYFWRVQASSATATSQWSTTWAFTTQAPGGLATPQLLVPTNYAGGAKLDCEGRGDAWALTVQVVLGYIISDAVTARDVGRRGHGRLYVICARLNVMFARLSATSKNGCETSQIVSEKIG